jgi:hypothetical protein
MVRPRLPTDDQVTIAKRHKNRLKVQQHRERQRQKKKLVSKTKATTTEVKAPPPTLPATLSFVVPARPYSFAVERPANVNETTRKKNNAMERVYCGRSRLKHRMRRVFQELEDTLVELKVSGFDRQKRGGGAGSAFKWRYQFDVYNHSINSFFFTVG